MQFIQKVSHHGIEALRFCIPSILSTKYGWSKDTPFMIYKNSPSTFAVEPVYDSFENYETSQENTYRKFVHYLRPVDGFKCFSFFIPKEIIRDMGMSKIKLLAVHDSGSRKIYLEAFPNGTKE